MATAFAVLAFEAFTVGQAPTAAPSGQKEKGRLPRTSDGRPDLQGLWDFRTVTPMERPKDVADTSVLTDVQAAALEQQILIKNNETAAKVTVGVDNTLWFDQGNKLHDKRSSLIVDPLDGRFPALTSEGQKRLAEREAAGKRIPSGPEDLSLSDRCMVGFNAGPPFIPTIYNNNVQIVQTSEYLVVVNEMNHNTRIIPLQEGPRLRPDMQQWHGDSRGRWEGETLVIETTNFRSEGNGWLMVRPNPDENFHLIERLTRVDASTLRYRFTVDDPTVWTKPWTVEFTMTPSDGLMYEFACHEGNYGMSGILKGARAEEKAAASEATSPK
jgi:hypothetical protein